MFRTPLVVSAALVLVSACGGDDSATVPTTAAPRSSDQPLTAPAPTTVADTTNPATDEAREAAGDAVDFWLTEKFFPGADIASVRECLIDSLVRDLSADEISTIQYLEPEHADADDVVTVELATPIFDECVDTTAFQAIVLTTFEDTGEFDAECAADLMATEYTLGESIRIFFSNAGTDDFPAELDALLTRVSNECPL